MFYLGDEGRGGGRLIFEVWWENTLLSVVAGESVNSGFDKNQTEFTVTILEDKFKVISKVSFFLKDHVRYIFIKFYKRQKNINYAVRLKGENFFKIAK